MSAFGTPPAWQTPILWPQGARAAHAAPRGITTLTLLKAAIVAAVLTLTLLDRFGLKVSATTAISICTVGIYGLAFAMVFCGAARLNTRAALGFLAIAATAGASFLVNAALGPPPYVSFTSLCLLLLLYAPFCVSLRADAVDPDLWRWTLRVYVGFALVVGLAGILQYFAQFATRATWLFDYGHLIPERIRTAGHWNTVHHMGLWIKSNGFFMREPAFFSIVMALAILCELSLAKRKWVLGILGLGLLLSYSGSGLLLLGTALLFPLGRSTAVRVLAVGMLATATFYLLEESLNLGYTVNRVNEFASTGSSAYCRFVFPTVSAIERLNSSPWTSLLGHGPGSIVRMGATCPSGFETALAKGLFEYGLPGLVAFLALILGAVRQAAPPVRLQAAGVVTWLVLTGLLAAETLLFIYLVSAMWPRGFGAAAAQASEGNGRSGRS